MREAARREEGRTDVRASEDEKSQILPEIAFDPRIMAAAGFVGDDDVCDRALDGVGSLPQPSF